MLTPLEIQVRFADIDSMGHVNNAIYLNYFEQARFHYFKQIVNQEWDWRVNGLILVKNEVEYLRPLLLNEIPFVSIHLIEIGQKSFTLGYEVKVNDQVYTKGVSKLVCFNYSTNKSVTVHPDMVKGLKKLEV